MISEKRAANALGGKTARPCDSCLQKRARWYCVADDAFLCQSCDSSVHCANPLASRHERVRIEDTPSFKPKTIESSSNNGKNESAAAKAAATPLWHQGFTKKARTPRPISRNNRNYASGQLQGNRDDEGKKVISRVSNDNPLVPEIGYEEELLDDDFERIVDENLLFQVPVFDPFGDGVEATNNAGLVNNGNNEEENINFLDNIGVDRGNDCYRSGDGITCDFDDDDNLHGFLPSDLDLAEFAADVESLLGGGCGHAGLDEDSYDVKGFGFLDCKEENDENMINNNNVIHDNNVCVGDQKVKVEDEEVEAPNWNFDYESLPVAGEEVERKMVAPVADTTMVTLNLDGNDETISKGEVKRNVSLRLNYEAVIAAWASQGCPWTTGIRPEFDPNDHGCWPDCTVSTACTYYHKLVLLIV